jgi:PEGA domain-containing protein
MKRHLPVWSALSMATLAFLWLSALPAAAQGDRGPAAAAGDRGGSGGAGGAGASAGGGSAAGGGGGGGSAAAGSGGGSSSGGGGFVGSGSGGTRGVERAGATGGSGYAVPRGERERSEGGGRAIGRSGGADRASDAGPGGVPAYARPRDGKEPVGTAVPRGSVPSTGGGAILVPVGYYGGYYDPWWYGAGYIGAYGGYYDPWYGGYPTSGQGTYSASSAQDEGKLRLKIKPRQAEVYVDGYFVGIVDDFDGLFQRLHLDTGPHRVEIRAPGFEPLEINVRISLDHTTTYEGELKKIP